MNTHPAGTLARITWTRPSGRTATSNAIRATLDTGLPIWVTDQANVIDDEVTKVVPLVAIDLTDSAGLGMIVDDANVAGEELTVHQLLYALREHRVRTLRETVDGFWPGTYHCDLCRARADAPADPASTTDAAKRNAEKREGTRVEVVVQLPATQLHHDLAASAVATAVELLERRAQGDR